MQAKALENRIERLQIEEERTRKKIIETNKRVDTIVKNRERHQDDISHMGNHGAYLEQIEAENRDRIRRFKEENSYNKSEHASKLLTEKQSKNQQSRKERVAHESFVKEFKESQTNIAAEKKKLQIEKEKQQELIKKK